MDNHKTERPDHPWRMSCRPESLGDPDHWVSFDCVKDSQNWHVGIILPEAVDVHDPKVYEAVRKTGLELLNNVFPDADAIRRHVAREPV